MDTLKQRVWLEQLPPAPQPHRAAIAQTDVILRGLPQTSMGQ